MLLCLLLAILITYCALLIVRNKKFKAFRLSVIVILAIILLSYGALLIDTNSVMHEVRNAFLWKTDPTQTAVKGADFYNDSEYFTDQTLGNVHLILVRLFTLHNFRDGYIWAFYCYVAYNTDGEMFTGSWNVPTKWQIHKENGKWEITEIFEAP